MRCLPSSLSAALAALLCCVAPVHAQDGVSAAPRPALGLMGTIPIYWGEAADVAEVVGGQAKVHWARARLETRFALRPLDTLDEAGLADLDFLLLAQPRALSPAENVALDAWVRAGGHLLLFADPMLTGESRFAIGDRRRPQDVILLSPILGHWGLRLEFDVEHPEAEETVAVGDVMIPVNRPGRFALLDGEGACELGPDSILATCRLGNGRATVLADAAVLDLHAGGTGAEAAFDWLIERGFLQNGEFAGTTGEVLSLDRKSIG
jgi:hypothetical protein